MTVRVRNLALTLAALLLAAPLFAQNAPPAERVVRMNGALPAAAGQQATVHFAIYDANEGGKLLWQETQVVAVDGSGQYTAFLGAMSASGMPLDVFAGGAPRWLAIEGPNGQVGARTLLAAVPYAVTAANAATLAGRPATDFLLTPAARRADAVAAGDTGAAAATTPLVNNGSANFIGKFFNNVDLINSQVFDNGSGVGVGTTSPLDKMHVQFTNSAGSLTGYAVQNLSGGANAYSGMLFYDQNGALGQFQGFNNSSHEYRINNIASGGSINFMLASDSKFKVVSNGGIGLGAGSLSLTQRLENYGTTQNEVTFLSRRHGGTLASPTATGTGANLFRFEGGGYDGTSFTSARGYLQIVSSEAWNSAANGTEINFATTANGTTSPLVRLAIDNSGKIGIGTTTPGVTLDVAGSDVVNNSSTSAYFFPSSSALTTGYTGNFFAVTIRASNYIVGGGIGAISDARIKNVKGHSDSALDLDTLNRIQITDYLFKDTVEHTSAPQKKVIAQQVEQVFPQAVSQMTEVVPDIFTNAPIKNGWVSLSTDLKVGDRVRLMTQQGHKAVHEVLEVADGRFRTDFTEEAGRVFVYGREVKDFRVVDYEAIGMLNVSATQELARRLEQQTAETAELKDQVAQLRAALATAIDALNAAKNRQ
ncbi:MAG: tail fiber domain-containing protein [Vicinamibacterales bacterium]